MIRQNKTKIAWFLLLLFTFEIAHPLQLMALSGGPSQPEFQSFEPIGTTEMVNLPSGDFQYNIPLLDIGGYPLNLSYHSGITADQESTIVGLGWTINPGVINRNVRALPDDFKGDKVTKEFNMRPNQTFGISGAASIELFGSETLKRSLDLNLSMGVNYNNYKGLGYEFGVSPSFSAGLKGGGKLTSSIGLNASSGGGVSFAPNLNYSQAVGEEKHKTDSEDYKYVSTMMVGANSGFAVNSRSGLQSFSLSTSVSESSNISYWETVNDKPVAKNYNLSLGSAVANATFSFAGASHMPNIEMPMSNSSVSFSFKPIGAELFGTFTSPSISGYYSEQRLRQNIVTRPTFGTLYSQHGKSDVSATMDFSRENDGAFHKHTAALPTVVRGQDIYSVAGQGIGGSYQLKRGDVGIMFDSKSSSISNGGSIGVEAGPGNAFHAGVDLKFNHTDSHSKKWDDKNNSSFKDFEFQGKSIGDDFEPAYFRAAGEMAVDTDLSFYKAIGKDTVVGPDLNNGANGTFKVDVASKLMNHRDKPLTDPIPTDVKRRKRQRRSQAIQYLTAKEASHLQVHSIENYPLNEFIDLRHGNGASNIRTVQRQNSRRKAHHISEITTLRPDGMRYVFGIPAYNLKKREVSFNVSGRQVDCTTGLVNYHQGDNTTGNKLGKDHYFNAVNTPAYAHSYLLSAVLSQDYEDLTQDGLSEDDNGSYTKFNYSRINEAYEWRLPIEKKKANYQAGLYSLADDDKGSYIYGEKEIWQIHSIESKTMVAEFYYSNRDDGHGVEGEDGGIGSMHKSVKLDKIVLYSKPDRRQNKEDATPIKTVVFTYDYSLCPGAPNSTASNKGKLTLKQLHVTYGHSHKAALSKYTFKYKNEGVTYDMKSYDRWGTYKPNTINPDCQRPLGNDGNLTISNSEMPYAEQDPGRANPDAGTWSLKQIDLPSGGTIKVQYGGKHYSHVQDLPAMQMFKIKGVETHKGSILHSGSPIGALNGRVYIDVPASIATKQEFDERYLGDLKDKEKYVYLKCFVKLNSTDIWEYVNVYAQITDCGLESTTDGPKAWLKLKAVPINDNSSEFVSPITKMSLQYLRQNLPEIAYGSTNLKADDLMNKLPNGIQPFLSLGTQVLQFFKSFNKTCFDRLYAAEIDIQGRSMIRLFEPNKMKFGGGAHVQQITIQDNWASMATGGISAMYGQEYDYTTYDSGLKKNISSGVASWEPMIGGEENPHRYHIVVNEERKWAIDNIHYTVLPLAESLMPGPQIVYSEIKVRNIKPKDSSGNEYDVGRTSTGHSVMKYFTARDFPTKVGNTSLEREPKRMAPIFSLLKLKMKEHMNAVQGFYVEKNNMHGQARSKAVYDELGSLISKVEYKYKLDAAGDLDNLVETIKPDGSVSKGGLGVDYDMVADARYSKSLTTSGGVNFNVDGFALGPIPAIVPVPWPSFEQNEQRFRSMTLTKVIQKNGILEKTVAWDLGSEIETENLAYDAETGEVILTKTYNEFNDPIYNLKLPAHWSYEGMALAYKNQGFTDKATTVSNGVANVTKPGMFFPGDELLIENIVSPLQPIAAIHPKAWVLHVNPSSIYIIDERGNPVSINSIGQSVSIKIIRSGHRNMPTQSIGSITSTNNPIVGRQLNFDNRNPSIDPDYRVINAGAIQYHDEWQTYCCNDPESGQPQNLNPFLQNVRGAWRPLRSWVHLSERDRSVDVVSSSSTNIRENGFYSNFRSFWQNPQFDAAQQLWTPNSNQWTWTTSVTKFNPNGTELENVDRLGRFSCETLGYHDMLVTGVAANTRYQEAAFDGFEDYYYNDRLAVINDILCPKQRHFGLGSGQLTSNGRSSSPITDQEYHTGKYSLNVDSDLQIELSYPVVAAPCIDNSLPSALDPSLIDAALGGTVTIPIITNPANVANKPFVLDDCDDCIEGFSPTPGKYVLTAWVKENDGLGATNYVDHAIEIDDGVQMSVFKAQGGIIEGWQRIYGVFDIDDNATDLMIRLQNLAPNTSISHQVYFDDLRIYPFNGSMKNFVYDDISLKLLAELDDNGYASFYDYDASGELIRIKKETERGIMTIQESRSSLVKKYPTPGTQSNQAGQASGARPR